MNDKMNERGDNEHSESEMMATGKTDSGDIPLVLESNNCDNQAATEKEAISEVEPQKDVSRQDSYVELSLDTLPSELFLHICSFIDAKFVIKTLSKVCTAFHTLIMDNTFWKVRIARRWPKKYPAIPGRTRTQIEIILLQQMLVNMALVTDSPFKVAVD